MLQGEHSVILSTFIKLPFVIKIFVLSTLEWPFYTGFTEHTFPSMQWIDTWRPWSYLAYRPSISIVSLGPLGPTKIWNSRPIFLVLPWWPCFKHFIITRYGCAPGPLHCNNVNGVIKETKTGCYWCSVMNAHIFKQLQICRLAPVLKQFFINVSYHILVASLTLMALF